MWTGEIEWIRRQNLKKVDHCCVCWMVFFLFWYIKPKLASMWCWACPQRGSAFVFLVCMIWWFLSVIVMLILEVI